MLELPEKNRQQLIISTTQTSHRLPVQNCPKKTKAQQQTYRGILFLRWKLVQLQHDYHHRSYDDVVLRELFQGRPKSSK